MRVAHVVSGSPGPDAANGVRRYIYFIARAQAALGLEVCVLALADEPVPIVPGVVVRGFRPSLLPFQVPRALFAELESWRPDLLHLHSPYFPPNVTLARWARRRRLPYVVTPHGALSPGEIQQRWYLKLPYKFLFELSILNCAAFVHAVGADEDLSGYGVTAPVLLAPCGIDLPSVAPRSNRAALAVRYPRLLGKRVFAYLGRLEPEQKGLDLLIQAFAAGLAGAALILGGPDYRGGRRRLERLVTSLRAPGPVLFPGPLYGKEKLDFLAGTDVFVHPSRWEGMPLAVLEAASMAIPCLVTPSADPFRRLSASGGAVSVEPAVGAIAEGLRRLHRASEAELRRMGERARETVASEFPWQRGAEILTEAYAKYAKYETLAPAAPRREAG